MSSPNYTSYDLAFTNRINLKNNGRVDIMNGVAVPAFAMFQETNKNTTYKDTALEGIHTKSPLSCSFFSIQNIQIIQNAIRNNVYKESNGEYIIGPQSQTELQIIMRAIFLQNSKNLPYNIREQIQELNDIVVNESVPMILNNVKQYKGYLFDASTLPIPMARSKNESIKGSRVLQQKPF